MDEDEPRAWYQRLVTYLGAAYQTDGDPTIQVLRSYLRLKGLPPHLARLRSEEIEDEPELEHVRTTLSWD